jgi:hypothetical protein
MGEKIPSKDQTDVPSPARMYDYFLGGYHNFEVDRAAAEKVKEINPEAPMVMRANRAFLRRVVSFLAHRGIDQFLDIGSGIPTAGNVHEIAHQVNPDCRVVYVDVESVAVRHAEEILAAEPNAGVIEADARRPEEITVHPEVLRHLDFGRPVAVLLFCVLHFFEEDEEALHAVRTLRDTLASGSYVAISHATNDGLSEEHRERIEKVYSRTAAPLTMRPREPIEGFFMGLGMVEPGLTFVPLWQPESEEDIFLGSPEHSVTYGGVGYKT